MSDFLQGLAGERGATGPSVSVGPCVWASPRAMGYGAGAGYQLRGCLPQAAWLSSGLGHGQTQPSRDRAEGENRASWVQRQLPKLGTGDFGKWGPPRPGHMKYGLK